MTEFTLSDEIFEIKYEGHHIPVILQNNVKEFIKIIINHIDLRNKQLIDNGQGVSEENMLKTLIYQELKVFIKERAGEKLI